MSDAKSPTSPADRLAQRRRLLKGLAGAVAVAGGAWIVYGLVTANRVSTDDAYISGDVVQVTSEVPGTVLSLHADDTQLVASGQPLIELDPADARVASQAAEAGLAQAVRRARALFAQADQLKADIAAREADLKRAQDDFRRRSALVASGAISREDYSHSQDSMNAQSAALTAARAALDQIDAQIAGTTVATHPDVLAAEARLRDSALALHRTRIAAPVDGIVAKRNVEVGQHVESGSPLMAIVPLGNLWVDANFKEVQLDRMRVGQKATITTDLYGGGVTYHGTVAGLSAGTGSAFSLLPAQNATGNWIKIVQRLPVRILLDPVELKAHPLRIGLSATVDVDLSNGDGQTVSTSVRSQPFPAMKSDADDPEVDRRIAAIIRANSGDAPGQGVQ